jgi:hypothetical protein
MNKSGFGMTLKTTMLATSFGVIISFSVTAQAATLVPLSGDVYDRKGNQGFHHVTSATEVKPGDTVMAGPNGSAKINFGDGCSISVGAGQTVTVPAQCQGLGQAPVEIGAGQYLVGGAVVGIAGIGIYEAAARNAQPVSP